MSEREVNRQNTDVQSLEQRIRNYLGDEYETMPRCDACRHHCPLRIPACYRGEYRAAEQGVDLDKKAIREFFGREI